jgi:hypothetical protein
VQRPRAEIQDIVLAKECRFERICDDGIRSPGNKAEAEEKSGVTFCREQLERLHRVRKSGRCRFLGVEQRREKTGTCEGEPESAGGAYVYVGLPAHRRTIYGKGGKE